MLAKELVLFAQKTRCVVEYNNSDYILWIGGTRGLHDDSEVYYWIDNGRSSLIEVDLDEKYWYGKGPSLTDPGQNNVREDCLSLLFEEETGEWKVNDEKNNLLDGNERYKDKMGYICEY